MIACLTDNIPGVELIIRIVLGIKHIKVMNFKELAESATYYKRNEKGVAQMSGIMEEIAREGEFKNARETAANMIKDGDIPLEKILRYVSLLTMDDLLKVRDEVTQSS